MIRSYASLLFWLGLIIGASLMLYHTSNKVHLLDRQLRTLNAKIDYEKKNIHVLRAEWAYLTNPSRIASEASRHLGMKSAPASNVASRQNMAYLFAKRETEASASLAQNTHTPTPTTKVAMASPPQATPRKTVRNVKRERALAKLNSGRINDRMKMEVSTAPRASTDRIGALIGKLGLHP